MLTLTENASTVVKTIVDQSEEQQEAGLRISQDAPDSPALHVITTEAPQPGDQVLEEDGARVFLTRRAIQQTRLQMPFQVGDLAADCRQRDDQVLEEDGARVFLEETAAVTLDDKVLDATVDEGGGVQFSIAPQA